MSWTLVALEDALAQPWRNGGGVTRELLAWPKSVDWTVRLSVADIDSDGPFSRFPGVERWFAVLEGSGVWLDVDGAATQLDSAAAPLRFPGEADVGARLVEGATRDFNLMVRPGTAVLKRLCGTLKAQPALGAFIAVYAHSHAARLSQDSSSLTVPRATLAWRIHTGGAVQVASDNALWMEVKGQDE